LAILLAAFVSTSARGFRSSPTVPLSQLVNACGERRRTEGGHEGVVLGALDDVPPANDEDPPQAYAARPSPAFSEWCLDFLCA
jgi:hypothetical protein